MKKLGILNQDISNVVAGMGHLDMLVIGDAGLPIPSGTHRIDLALCPGVPGFLQTVQTVAEELKVQQILIAHETFSVSPTIGKKLKEIFQGVEVVEISHNELKELSAKAKAVIRTGEFTPYANIILVSGVVF
ncbi:MAG TPA: D-ribose pyranase [Anaerolineaceae bacterium]|nr:D-ribose pyranase [Anaerolineaceae bacterium]